jgi:hypothetical protein
MATCATIRFDLIADDPALNVKIGSTRARRPVRACQRRDAEAPNEALAKGIMMCNVQHALRTARASQQYQAARRKVKNLPPRLRHAKCLPNACSIRVFLRYGRREYGSDEVQ